MKADGIDASVAGGGDQSALTVKKATDDFLNGAKSNVKDPTLKLYRIHG